jgi:hypothetical protein
MTDKKTTAARPKLGELEPGHPVMVRRSPNDMRRRPPEERYIPARVVKAARVWIDLESTDERQFLLTWRMRRDTQDEASQYISYNASFATLDQHAWDQTREWALATLRDHGIDLLRQSPWRGREIELADLLSKVDPNDTP